MRLSELLHDDDHALTRPSQLPPGEYYIVAARPKSTRYNNLIIFTLQRTPDGQLYQVAFTHNEMRRRLLEHLEAGGDIIGPVRVVRRGFAWLFEDVD